MIQTQNDPGTLAGKTGAAGIETEQNNVETTERPTIPQSLKAAAARARAAWLAAADRLADAADHTSARHEMRELRLFARELGFAASAAAADGSATQ